VESLVEESLRYDSPIQGFFRNTKQEIELHGVVIPVNAKVMVSYASANRDGDHFSEPDEYRIDRNPDDHLAFGKGNHSCLGAQLARLEARTLARSCLERLAGMTLSGDPERTANPLLRGIARLPVVVKPR
jgi:cytochrome P450